MRFLATADWQLGMTAHFLDDEARHRFHQARFDAVRRIGELAAEVDAEFVVVGGDIFESNQLQRSVVSKALEAVRDYPVPLVLLPGNHDPLDAASIYDDPAFAARKPDHVHVLREPGLWELAPGIEIIAAPWYSKRPLSDLVAEACDGLEPAAQGVTRVVLGHGAVSTLDPNPNNPAQINVDHLSEIIATRVAHVAILGDRHSTTEVAPNIWYPGAPEVTARREDDAGNVLIIDVDDEGVTVEKRRVGTWRFLDFPHYFSTEDDVVVFEQVLAAMPDKDRTALWLSLTGALSTRGRARLDQIIDEQRDVFARIDFWERHTDLVVVPEDSDFEDLGLTGFAGETLAELAELARSGNEQATTAQDALGMLFRFAAGGTK